VNQGEIIGKVGDPEETCITRSHLHLEIRSAGRYGRAFNPVPLIASDWEALTLHGAASLGFARDLNQARHYQNLYMQPDVSFWGPTQNEYTKPWPLDWNP
jgi:hypothetical protein